MRFLDYQKVKEAEREQGRELFGTAEEPTALAAKASSLSRPFFRPQGLTYSADHGQQDQELRCLYERLGAGCFAPVTDKTDRRREEAVTGEDQEGDQSAGDHCTGEGAERGTAADRGFPWGCYGGVDVGRWFLHTVICLPQF